MVSLIKKLIKKKLKISFAESCTGGLLASKITSVSGSSKVFSLGLITYSNQAKIKILKVNKNIINKYGAVSLECCKAMVVNLSKISKANINVSITGIAGPNGGSIQKPVGLCSGNAITKPLSIQFINKTQASILFEADTEKTK